MLVIVQARMSSRRVPGKVLRKIAGRPILQWTLERVQRAKSVSNLVVATSVLSEDDPIERLCRKLSVKCFRGDLNDVRSRYIEVLRNEQSSECVRICADSPLIDPALIDQGVSIALKGSFDLVTNVLTRSFPVGQSVEVVSTQALLKMAENAIEPEDKEHVTTGFYKENTNYNIRTFSHNRNLGHIQLAVDTEQDIKNISQIVELVDAMAAGWEELVVQSQSISLR